jgi:hypothetical protein
MAVAANSPDFAVANLNTVIRAENRYPASASFYNR